MSVSAVSSYASTSWEEYLEELRKKQQQKNASAGTAESPAVSAFDAFQSDLSPKQILSELQGIQDDPEKLKARAAELAAETAEAAGNSSGMHAQMLGELASDLADVAESGDLSVIEERLARHPGGAAKIPSMLMGFRIEEESDDDEDDEDESALDAIKALLAEIRESIEHEDELSASDETTSGLSLESLVSKFQTLKEAAASKTSDGQGSAETDVSIETLISKIKSNLTDQLRARYSNIQTQYPSVSLSG